MQADITLRGVQPYLSFLGTFVQLGAALLLIALFSLLRRYARRRRYFRTWSNAWVALSIALAAVVLRYNLLPEWSSAQLLAENFNTKLLHFVYQGAKFFFYGFLIGGTLRYVRSSPGYTAMVGVSSFSVLYAALSVWQSADLNEAVVWQAPVGIAALGFCAVLMLRLPPSRRSLGSSITGVFFAFGALLWATYLAAFNFDAASAGSLSAVVTYNTYLDLIWHLCLGFGMVVLLMEDVKHETDAAHAELAVAHDNLRRASFYDTVTGSLNRQAFADGLGLEAATAGFGAVLMLDMDDLKRINDDHGHAAGDAALRYLVNVLRATLRTSDKLYRWGGDEFLAVCPGADARKVTRRMRNLLGRAEQLALSDGTQLTLNVSLGGAHFSSGEQLAAAIDKADRAMYADKIARKKAGTQEITQGV